MSDVEVINEADETDVVADEAPVVIEVPAQGPQGPGATVTINSVTTGAPGSSASVVNVGTSADAVLNIVIPRGDVGATGPSGTMTIGTVTASAPGGPASFTNVGTSIAAIWNIVLPRGEQGPQGVQGLPGEVPAARTISTTGLASGGGNLSANRTIDVPLATQPEAEAGAINDKAMSPLRVWQAIAKYVQTLIQNAIFSTGDIKPCLKLSADSGWIMMNDSTIGNVGSGAVFASASAQALFTLLYGTVADPYAPLLTSAGAPTTRAAQGAAATAWTNGCRMQLPKTLGRALAQCGTGSGLTTRSLGQSVGEETHAQTNAELVNHGHAVTPTNFLVHNNGGYAWLFNPNAGSGYLLGNVGDVLTNGSSVPFNVMQPTAFVNFQIKL